MSREDVKLVRELTDAFNRLDLDAFVALLSPDVVWEVNPELPGLRDVYHGRAEVRELQKELLELGEGIHVEVREITDLSDGRVFNETVITGRGRGSGLPVDLHYWTVLWVAEGKIARRQVWMERDEALKAAGLPRETVELAQRFLDAYNRQDVEAMLKDLDAEIEWHSGILKGLGGEASVYRGHDGFREGLRDIFDALAETHIEYTETRVLGDRFVAIGHVRTRGRKSGAETGSPHASVVDLKDGKAVRIRAYLDPKEALEAAGLSE